MTMKEFYIVKKAPVDGFTTGCGNSTYSERDAHDRAKALAISNGNTYVVMKVVAAYKPVVVEKRVATMMLIEPGVVDGGCE